MGWTCSGCTGANPDGTLFCGHCGARQAAAVQTWSCRECGAANAVAMGFCGRCGGQRRAARQEELRFVTALFADISGFTTLADTLDVESLHDVIHPLVAGLARIAEKYEGFVEKYAGDAVLVIYGAPVTHEDDPQRALLAALDMHAALPRLLAEIGPAAAGLTIHIGVNTGRVLAGQTGSDQQSDYAVLGDSVILAQRLESVCPPGQTYVGTTTYELTRNEFDFESVGELQLKGKLKPVEGFRLIGRRRTDALTSRPLVGRREELALLDQALSDGRGLVTVVGEPGVGKSRLLAEARRQGLSRGVTWLSARCLSYGSALPYWPVADLIRQTASVHLDDDVEVLQTKLTGALPAVAVPAALRLLGASADDATPEQARRHLHDGVIAWFRELAGGGPTTLLLEDVHWADPATLELLGEVARSLQDVPLLLICSTRPEGGELLARVGVREQRIDLTALGVDAVGDLVESVLGSPATEELVSILAARTGGNPLFVEELTRSLHETEGIVPTAGGWAPATGLDLEDVPHTVERVFAARLDVLPPAAAALLQKTAVVGRSVRMSLLRAVVAPDDVDEPLRTLVDAGLIDRVTDGDEASVSFHHALLQDVVYGRLLRKRRRELHRTVADVGRQLYGDGDETIELLARHLYLADAGEEAVAALLRAARRAAGLWANDAAVVHLQRAVEVLEKLPPSARLDEARLELARLQELRGEYDEALDLYLQARTRLDNAAAWRGVLGVLRRKGQYEEAVREFGAALAAVGPRNPDSAELWLECGSALASAGRTADAISALLTGLRLTADADPRRRAELLVQLATALNFFGDYPAAQERAEHAAELFTELGDVRGLLSARRALGTALAQSGKFAAATDTYHEALDLAHRTGTVEEIAGMQLNLAQLLVLQGQYDDALALHTRSLADFERLGHGSGRAMARGNLAENLLLLDRAAEALETAEQACELAGSIGHTATLADAGLTAALALHRLGRDAEAKRRAEAAATYFAELDDDAGQRRALELASNVAGSADVVS